MSPPDQSSTNINGGGRRKRAIASIVMLAAFPATTTAFSSNRQHPITSRQHPTQYRGRQASIVKLLSSQKTNNEIIIIDTTKSNNNKNTILRGPILSIMTAASIALATTTTAVMSPPQPAFAFEESDYASETVTNVVAQLKSTAGDIGGTFNAFEEVSKIITEGKGVGGTLTYDGVKLNEGFIADEDTTIYNPGLTLLTNSEKERLVSAVIDNRKIGLSTQQWSEDNEYAFGFLKQKLDPLHMYELEGYLGILPFYGAALYLGALFAQKNARDIFPLVYGLCALGVFGPVILLVASGP
ncbi:hypothetical protein ACHAXR_002810 [Thalassiosira sp. AJA248-18]